MVKNTFYLIPIILIGLLSYGCDEATLVGYDLLEGEDIDVKFVDTFSLTAYSIEGDPVHSNINFVFSYPLGSLNDPFFGKTETDLYSSFLWTSNVNISKATLDSTVLIYGFDTTSFYGNWKGATYDVKTFAGIEEFPIVDSFYTNSSLETEQIASSDVMDLDFDPADSLLLLDVNLDSLILQSPQMRIPIDPTLGSRIFNKIGTYSGTVEFREDLPFLKVSVRSNNSSMAGINYTSLNNGIGGLLFYYRDSLDNNRSHEFELSTSRALGANHDKSGYPIESFLQSSEKGDSLLFVQSLGGVHTHIDLSSLHSLQGNLINKVELVLTVVEEEAYQTDVYTPITSYFAWYIDEDGERTLIRDNQLSNSISNLIFNGAVEEVELDSGETVKQVRMNITNHVLQLLDNPEISSEIIITPSDELSNAGRTIFYGPGNSVHPLKVNVAYTTDQ